MIIKTFYKFSYRFLLILISAIFTFAGVDKIILRPEMVEAFRIFGFPKEFMVIIGFTELILAMMLQARYFTKLAIHGLMFILSVAILLHLINEQYVASLLPIAITGTLVLILRLGQTVKNLG